MCAAMEFARSTSKPTMRAGFRGSGKVYGAPPSASAAQTNSCASASDGKTVTLTLAVGLFKPDSGKIIVDGEDITKMSERELAPVRRKVQLIFQSGALFDSLTVWENVGFPLTDAGESDEVVETKVREYL